METKGYKGREGARFKLPIDTRHGSTLKDLHILYYTIFKIDSLISQTQDCITDLKDWMITNKLQLNDDKTEIMFVTKHSHLDLPSTISINDCSVSVSTSVCSLGIILDQSLSFEKPVSSICKAAYLKLRRINSVHHFLSTDATKSQICAFVLCRLDYCNSLLAGLPKYLIERLQ